MSRKIVIIGGGNLGIAIAEGLLDAGFCEAGDITVTRRRTEMLFPIQEKGIRVSGDNLAAVRDADVVILAVKPFQVSEAVAGFQTELKPGKLLISVVTGVSIADIEAMLNQPIPIFRAMPNTAIAIGESMTCICSSVSSTTDAAWVSALFSKLGKVVTIPESLMDAATILGACGTAYAMRYIRASIQGGIEIGFDAHTASLISAQTVKGAACLLLERGAHPEQEIDKVTTPKGCTIAGLNEMEHRGFSSSLIRGIIASFNKIGQS